MLGSDSASVSALRQDKAMMLEGECELEITAGCLGTPLEKAGEAEGHSGSLVMGEWHTGWLSPEGCL